MQQSFDCGITSAELTQSKEPRPPGIERCCDLPKSANAPIFRLLNRIGGVLSGNRE